MKKRKALCGLLPGGGYSVRCLCGRGAQGRARMVQVGDKPETERTAEAVVRVLVSPQTFSLIESGGMHGDYTAE